MNAKPVLTERERYLFDALMDLRGAEWMCSIDWCPHAKRDQLLERIDEVIESFDTEMSNGR